MSIMTIIINYVTIINYCVNYYLLCGLQPHSCDYLCGVPPCLLETFVH